MSVDPCAPYTESCADGAFWLGRPGNLLRIDGGHGSIEREWSTSTTMHVTAAGMPRAQTSPLRPFREWSVDLEPTFVRQHAGLHELIVTDPGPHVFVEPWAQVTNVMTPAGSTLTDRLTDYAFGGGWDIDTEEDDDPYDRVSRVLLNPGAQGGNDAIVHCGLGVVVPHMMVTGSVYVASETDARAALDFYDIDGNVLEQHVTPTATGMDRLRRIHVTKQAPAKAAAARVFTTQAEVMARPAITWTDRLMDWGIGGLAQQCVIRNVSDSALQAGRSSRRAHRRASVSFSISETGGFVE